MELTFGHLPEGYQVEPPRTPAYTATTKLVASGPIENPLPEDFDIVASASAATPIDFGRLERAVRERDRDGPAVTSTNQSFIEATLLWVDEFEGPLTPLQVRTVEVGGGAVWIMETGRRGVSEVQQHRGGYLVVVRFRPDTDEDTAVRVLESVSWA